MYFPLPLPPWTLVFPLYSFPFSLFSIYFQFPLFHFSVFHFNLSLTLTKRPFVKLMQTTFKGTFYFPDIQCNHMCMLQAVDICEHVHAEACHLASRIPWLSRKSQEFTCCCFSNSDIIFTLHSVLPFYMGSGDPTQTYLSSKEPFSN